MALSKVLVLKVVAKINNLQGKTLPLLSMSFSLSCVRLIQWWGTAFAFKLRHAPSGPSAHLAGDGFRRKRSPHHLILLSRGIHHVVHGGKESRESSLKLLALSLPALCLSWVSLEKPVQECRLSGGTCLILVGMRKK